MNQTPKKHELLVLSGQYGEDRQVSKPHITRGFALENEAEYEICPFYEYCVVEEGLTGQMNCMKNNGIICKHNSSLKNLS